MNKLPVIAIDLGTTNCLTAIYDQNAHQPSIIKNKNGNKITPSIIQFDGENIIIGDEAKEAYEAGDVGCVTAFKRYMGSSSCCAYIGNKEYTAVELTTLLLKYLKDNVETVLQQPIYEVIITVPAYFRHKERQATLQAAKNAGLKVKMLINEPTAAALNYGIQHFRKNAKILVYDLGGGTFDVTLIEMSKENQINCLITKGNHILGGKDFDKCIFNYLVNQIYYDTGIDIKEYSGFINELMGRIEHIKMTLTNASKVKIKLNIPNYGVYRTELTNQEFENITSHLLDKTGVLCQDVLDELHYTWNDITDILLVGGSTRMPQVSKYLEKISGHKPIAQVHPDEAVVLGAAIQSILPVPKYNVLSASSKPIANKNAIVQKEKPVTSVSAMRLNDVQAHPLGMIAVNEEGTHYINQNIIPPNQSIPVKCARKFKYYTSAQKNNEIDIYLLQGIGNIFDCEILNKYVISGIRHKEEGSTLIRVQYSYDVSGIVHIQARQEQDECDLPIREEPVPKDMSMFAKPITQHPDNQTTYVFEILDTSGSMFGEPIEEAKKAMIEFIDKLKGDHVYIGSMSVSNRTIITGNLTNHPLEAKQGIKKLYCGLGGFGNCTHPFDTVYKNMHALKGRRIAIILADGVWSYLEAAKKAAKRCIQDGIEIIAIGFGDADYDFLRSISSSDKNAMKVHQSQLVKSFGNIAQTISETSHSKFNNNEETKTWEAIGEK